MEIPFFKLLKFGNELEKKLEEKPCTEKQLRKDALTG